MKEIANRAPDVCVCGWPEGCMCSAEERALRGYAAGMAGMTGMTPGMREECLAEIDRVEGYRRGDYASSSDGDLAHGVLNAWRDFCRDKGLL